MNSWSVQLKDRAHRLWRRRITQLWASFVAVSMLLGFVVAGLGVPFVGTSVAAAEAGIDVFEALPESLEERPLAQPSRIEDRNGELIAEFYWQNREEVPLDQVSDHMRDATLAVEDHRFYEHGGVDLQGVARAVATNVLTDQQEGGSTLTQQYVKNVLIQNNHADGDTDGVEEAQERSGAAGYARKLREMKLAAAVENKYSKDEILARYLNINSYSGSPNAYGVEAAAQQFWSIPSAELDIAQAATLAGIVRNPSLYNPQINPEETLERRNVVLGQMLTYGFITQEEHDEAVEQDLGLEESERPNGCAAAGDAAYFCDYVQHAVMHSAAFGDDPEARVELLKRGGLTIRTSLDAQLQEQAVDAVHKRVPVGDPSGAGHSLVSMEAETGEILAMAQNTEYDPAGEEGDGSTVLNYSVDEAYGGGGGYQPGSTWKPFVLAEWLDSGRELTDTVNGTGESYTGFSNSCEPGDYAGEGYAPANAGDSDGASSSMPVLEATKQSVNRAYADMASQLDMCDIRDTASALGVRTGSGDALEEVTMEDDSQQVLYPSSILGTVSVSPLTMASAFTAFANGGSRCEPRPILEAKRADGEPLPIEDSACEDALDPAVADGIAYAMSQTFEGGTTEGLDIGVPAAAKTGTTNFEVGSTWLVGFTSGISTAVWTGDPDGARDWRANSEGKMPREVFGATVSGPTWQEYMREAAPTREAREFAQP
ncbi:transglycosylase domain-containing protein [Brevibacterium daeguense]|uniref:Transglycosylase domain-containing protein n=1 Tax=Brevibacterium daeguense TaxID=909936 RepID=A0ABP8EIH4_9MICO|nr:transglycosylase domain-containing protein [Brevibacterium daeguense]